MLSSELVPVSSAAVDKNGNRIFIQEFSLLTFFRLSLLKMNSRLNPVLNLHALFCVHQLYWYSPANSRSSICKACSDDDI